MRPEAARISDTAAGERISADQARLRRQRRRAGQRHDMAGCGAAEAGDHDEGSGGGARAQEISACDSLRPRGRREGRPARRRRRLSRRCPAPTRRCARDAAMKSPFIRELKPDEIATAVFLVHTKEVRQKRTGEPYLSLVLADRTGEIDAKMWDNVAEVIETFDRDDFVKVKGLMQLYNNRPQFTIHKLRPRGRPRGRFQRLLSGLAAGSGGDVERAARHRGGARQRAHPRGCWMRFWTIPDIAARYQVAPAAKTHPSCVPQRPAGTRAFAVQAWRS